MKTTTRRGSWRQVAPGQYVKNIGSYGAVKFGATARKPMGKHVGGASDEPLPSPPDDLERVLREMRTVPVQGHA